jgi:hypothetical protein
LPVVVLGRFKITGLLVGVAEELVRPGDLEEVICLGGSVQQADGGRDGGSVAESQERRALHPEVAAPAARMRSTEPLLELFKCGVVIARVVCPIPVTWHPGASLPARVIRSSVAR